MLRSVLSFDLLSLGFPIVEGKVSSHRRKTFLVGEENRRKNMPGVGWCRIKWPSYTLSYISNRRYVNDL